MELDWKWVESEGKLLIEGKAFPASVRSFAEMKPVLFDKGFEAPADRPQYFMHRGILAREGLRYDVTVFPAGADLGNEFNKTFGHYHADAKPGLTFPEVYEVLQGQAHYLLQEKTAGGKGVKRALLVKARQGDKVVVPPNHGHVTINPGKETLVAANAVEARFKSDYSVYEERGGAAYYELVDGSLVANENYGETPELEEPGALNGGLPETSLFALLSGSPEKLFFLKDPSQRDWEGQ